MLCHFLVRKSMLHKSLLPLPDVLGPKWLTKYKTKINVLLIVQFFVILAPIFCQNNSVRNE
jgi:hypothetical protein